MASPLFTALGAYFEPIDIAWKPVGISREKGHARAVPYVSNRAIMDRLDRACGPENWRNEYRPGPSGGLLCGLSIRIVREDGAAEWITKWDGAENTDVSPVKGGLSASMRRAAVQWGIGRYLYRMPGVNVKVDERGRMVEKPALPAAYLPRALQSERRSPVAGKGTPAPRLAPANGEAVPNSDRVRPRRLVVAA
jgi:hypothetical protein